MRGKAGKKRGLHFWILAGMLAGAVTGMALGKSASPLGELGSLIIQLIKLFAIPLLVFAILDALVRTSIRGRKVGQLLGISVINTAFALAIGLGVSNWIRPGEILRPAMIESLKTAEAPPAARKLDALKALEGFVPKNWVDPVQGSETFTLVLLAALVGSAIRKTKNEQKEQGEKDYLALEGWIHSMTRSIEIVLTWIIRWVPLAVFGVVAKTVGEQGFAPLRGLAVYVGVALFGLCLQVGLVYQAWLKLVARMKLRDFWSNAKEPLAYAMGASSSLATLPVTLRSLDRMGVSLEASRLSACVGTNLNNDGILLYEAMAALFVAQVHGINLTIGQQLTAAGSSVLAGIGIAGIPEAGLISLSIVLTTVGLPLEILPLLLTVDWILSRARAMTNVTADMLGAVILDRIG